ncbi:hypothetical protein GUJ93_ZPchr0007g6127 [Zizania palustris]|uniref:Uncharacterized protein n=1 Tax=Zizania palustris TaxID=103762 RepID=A0A8J5VY18_ZIZPA|nr:hypothetical protein GUJ93_ZPchr0007g6127 [Zizania palustris]
MEAASGTDAGGALAGRFGRNGRNGPGGSRKEEDAYELLTLTVRRHFEVCSVMYIVAGLENSGERGIIWSHPPNSPNSSALTPPRPSDAASALTHRYRRTPDTTAVPAPAPPLVTRCLRRSRVDSSTALDVASAPRAAPWNAAASAGPWHASPLRGPLPPSNQRDSAVHSTPTPHSRPPELIMSKKIQIIDWGLRPTLRTLKSQPFVTERIRWQPAHKKGFNNEDFAAGEMNWSVFTRVSTVEDEAQKVECTIF